MESLFAAFGQAVHQENGYALAETLSPIPPRTHSGRLYAIQRGANPFSIQGDVRYAVGRVCSNKQESQAWTDVYVAYWKAVGEILTAEEAQNVGKNTRSGVAGADWRKVYESWKDLTVAVRKGYTISVFEAWTIPCLYVAAKYLRVFAIKADDSAREKKQDDQDLNAGFGDDAMDDDSGNEKLEDAARMINTIFGTCLSDRAPLEESRKYGVYYIASLLFKTYFRLNSISLCKNILRPIAVASGDMPPLELFPKSHQVAYNYYVGVIHFLDENYAKAEEYLNLAYQQVLATSKGNIQLILTYLIPTRLLTSHVLPTAALLSPYQGLQRLFGPLSSCIKRGDLAGFDAAMQSGEDEFVKRRIYLTLERGRDVCLRNLFRKVYMVGGYEEPKEGQAADGERTRRSRIPLAEFRSALRLAGEKEIDTDEVECLIANMIYKNLMKGYISRGHSMVVLNKKGAFPGTGV